MDNRPEPPQPPDQPNGFDPSTVNDLDTARLALRWALERLHRLSSEVTEARQEAAKALKARDEAAVDSREKDETVKRWRETVKAWEASISDHKKMEEQLREELRREIDREQDVHIKEERLQLSMQIDSLKREIAAREAMIGGLRREVIDAVKTARQDAERELQGALAHQEKALSDTKSSLLERLKIQSDALRAKEKDLESQQRLLDEQIKTKEGEFRRRYERDVEDLLKHNRESLSREERALSEKFEQN
ncbi:MAG: hypothetical protein Q7J64_04595, partial [Elusimicrobiota bacterium]|nr:hypothetical protein [Elusimicrobiota bacterium]